MSKENIWIICHYAQQPPLNTMLRYHNWGKELVKRGYTVTIVAASTIHNTDIDIVEKNGKIEDVCDGVQYKYIQTPKYSGNGMQRIKNMLAFCVGLKKFRKEKPDVLINCEAYLFPFVKHYFKGVPVITDTVDLWPESIIEYAGYSKTNPIIRVLYRLERNAYLKSNAMIFSMEGGEEYLKEQSYSDRIDFSKVFHVNMGCDISQKDLELEGIRFDLGWPEDKYNIVYCGSVRQANQVKQICEAAQEIRRRGYSDIYFHIYGNGEDLDELKHFCVNNDIDNIAFYGRIEKSKIPFILSHSNANVLTYKQVPLMKYGGSQSKLFDYLASGKPIISNAIFGYNLLERYDCGLVTQNQSSTAFADTVIALYNMPKDRQEEMGYNGRKAAELYDQPKLVDQLIDVVSYVKKEENVYEDISDFATISRTR